MSEFYAAYPELAELPLSQTHGRKLRRIVTEAEWSDVHVDPDGEGESAFTLTELDRREAATWGEALQAFLTAHTRYDGLMARFANDDGETFELPLTDAWGTEYHAKQYARARALQRQMSGGERPSGGDAVSAWERPATGMVTLTASSVPGGERLSPVDHLDALHDAWSYDGVRDTLRNVCEYHLGLDANEWGFWLQSEPHGVGAAADPDAYAGMNACYTHLHVGVYLDAAGLDGQQIGTELERIVEKHLDVCDPAGRSAHDYEAVSDYVSESDGCISVNMDVSNLGSYLAAYMGGSYDERLVERPVEYLAWGALYWSASRRRTSRSQVVNQAITADRCRQRAESAEASQSVDHGENIEWSDANGPDVVCSCCSSGWQVDQSRLDEPVGDDELADALPDPHDPEDTEPSLSELWRDADAAASVGESREKARVRKLVTRWRRANPDAVHSVAFVCGDLGIDPRHREFVADLLNDLDAGHGVDSFQRATPIESDWHLDAIVDADGEEHPPGEGGVDMVQLHLPETHVLEETRLAKPLQKGEIWRCGKCNVAIHDPEMMAGHLVDHGLVEPKAADRVLSYDPVSSLAKARGSMKG